MTYNAIIETDFKDQAESWFVTLSDVKRALNLLFDNTGSYEFDDDDLYLTQLIQYARSVIENYTGVFLTKGNLTVIFRNECGSSELPGPVQSTITFYDVDDNVISNVTLKGLHYKRVVSPCYDYIKAVYTAGFDVANQTGAFPKMPDALKKAWIDQCVWMYEHRGDEKEFDVCPSAQHNAAPYIREWKSVLL